MWRRNHSSFLIKAHTRLHGWHLSSRIRQVRRLKEVYDSWRRIFVQTMEARRTFRFFSETGIVGAIMKPACPWGDGWRLHFAVSKGFIIGCEN